MARNGSPKARRTTSGRVTPKGTTPPGVRTTRPARAPDHGGEAHRPGGPHHDPRQVRDVAPPIQRRTGTRGGR